MLGIKYFFKGARLLAEPGIRLFVILPLLVNLLLFGALTYGLVSQFGAFTNWLVTWLGSWFEWLLWLIWAIAGLLWLILYGYCFATISSLLAAPFYGLLAERVQLHLSGQIDSPPLTASYLLALLKRTLARELQKLVYLIPRLLVLVVISIPLYFVPGIGLLVPVIWFAWGAWSLALQNLDYSADNNRTGFSAMRTAMASERLLCLSFGSAVVVASSIPVLNLLALPAAVCGGTALWVDRWLDKASQNQ